MSEPTVTVVITTIPPREKLLARAVASVQAQTRPPDDLIVVTDTDRGGPSFGRNEGLERAKTDWVALLDDDDEFYPHHLETLLAHCTGTDLVYPWFDILDPAGRTINHHDPLKIRGEPAFGRSFDPISRDEILNYNNFVPVTVLLRREVMLHVGGFPTARTEDWPHQTAEDWAAWRRLLREGAWFRHVPERTWAWHWHGGNTSGHPDRW